METLASPCTGIIHNLPVERDDKGRPIRRSFTMIHNILLDLRYKIKKIKSMWNKDDFQGYALIEFGISDEDVRSSMKLESQFEEEGHGKVAWLSGNVDARPYLWVATIHDRQLLRSNVDYMTIPNEWRALAKTEAKNDIMDAAGAVTSWLANKDLMT
ncbi:hypothetical protein BVRB_007360 [Beta vulgaris subsp. vulgaris]|uniref:XS domain-containing protein n=1 Tax=Beta vulgaris subsp. vulgaris TaxID=3555 RepID=A0A0J8B346_BETVV|nr:hypothetical protein BVRB_007360 [Beta vulgaris subsp. vulgaris]